MKKVFLQLWNNPRLASLVQFIKFGIVGVSNTAISYVVENAGFYWLFASMSESPRVWAANLLAFFISVTNSYYWNNRFVFRKGEKQSLNTHLKAYLKTAACYALTGLILGPALKLLLTDWGIPYYLGSLMTLIITIPLNFLLNKFWAFRNK